MTFVADLCSLGLATGDRVVVHSSLRAVGPVEGGADAIVDALLDVLGPEGLLVVPAFTYDTQRFDPAVEPARTGALAEAVRLRPDAVRSLHPTYSVAALGVGATDLCADHELRAATGVDSPLDRLARAGGYVLLLGVGQIADTTVHVGEFRARAPYLHIPFSPAWPRVHEIVIGDQTRTVEYDRFPGCSRAFGVVERGLRESSAIRDGFVGRAKSQLVRGEATIEEAVTLLERDPSALLCSDLRCYRCTRAREELSRESGARDRGAEAGCDG
jgi:aminoglycoside 3-N-acetyltransferase